jgi:hypothetical protein
MNRGRRPVRGHSWDSYNGFVIGPADSRDAIPGRQQQTPRESERLPKSELGEIVRY